MMTGISFLGELSLYGLEKLVVVQDSLDIPDINFLCTPATRDWRCD